jgi:hypothetical protein
VLHRWSEKLADALADYQELQCSNGGDVFAYVPDWLRDRLQAMPKANKNPMAPNEFALQMLRFPFRQVFGDPDNTQGMQFYDFDKFVATVALPDWRDEVLKNLAEPGL